MEDTIIQWGRIASKYDTNMAHAMLKAVAVWQCERRGWNHHLVFRRYKPKR